MSKAVKKDKTQVSSDHNKMGEEDMAETDVHTGINRKEFNDR